MAGWRLAVRRRGAVDKERHATLGEALAALEARLDALAREAPRGGDRALGREYPAAQVVVARGELAERGRGGRRGGVDLHADRSTTPWTGRLRRRPVAPEPGETSYDALRRVLSA
jgi:hypothetical protein